MAVVAKLRKEAAVVQAPDMPVMPAAAWTGERPSLVAGTTLPASIGLCADEYNDVRTIRLAMEKEVEAVKARENEIREHIISNLSKSLDSGAAGKRYRAQIVMKTTPKLADWNKLCDFIYTNNRFELVQKRLGEKAVEDLWAAGVEVGGVERMQIPTVSITKI